LQTLSNKYTVHLFLSINGVKDTYHEEAERELAPWFQVSYYEVFQVPQDFIQNTHPESLLQTVNGKQVPYTVLSCFYNDRKAYELILEHQTKYSLQYDIICKLRADMKFENLEDFTFTIDESSSLILHSCIPWCIIRFFGFHNIPICICDAFAYGNVKTMDIYTNTYKYILQENTKRNGYFRINYEPSLHENCINFYCADSPDPDILNDAFYNNSRNLKITYFSCPYTLYSNRRHRDVIFNTRN
jgi:hypothetical protein